MTMTNINLPIPPQLLGEVDRARGDVPRTTWIRRAIQQRLDTEQAEPSRQWLDETATGMRDAVGR